MAAEKVPTLYKFKINSAYNVTDETTGIAVKVDKSLAGWTAAPIQIQERGGDFKIVGKLSLGGGETDLTLYSDRPGFTDSSILKSLLAAALTSMGFKGIRFDPKEISTSTVGAGRVGGGAGRGGYYW
jgi:hypothetical protein